jgi:hypothetical protein
MRSFMVSVHGSAPGRGGGRQCKRCLGGRLSVQAHRQGAAVAHRALERHEMDGRSEPERSRARRQPCQRHGGVGQRCVGHQPLMRSWRIHDAGRTLERRQMENCTHSDAYRWRLPGQLLLRRGRRRLGCRADGARHHTDQTLLLGEASQLGRGECHCEVDGPPGGAR